MTDTTPQQPKPTYWQRLAAALPAATHIVYTGGGFVPIERFATWTTPTATWRIQVTAPIFGSLGIKITSEGVMIHLTAPDVDNVIAHLRILNAIEPEQAKSEPDVIAPGIALGFHDELADTETARP